MIKSEKEKHAEERLLAEVQDNWKTIDKDVQVAMLTACLLSTFMRLGLRGEEWLGLVLNTQKYYFDMHAQRKDGV